MRKCRSSDEIYSLNSELKWSEKRTKISFAVVRGGGSGNINRSRRKKSTIDRCKSVLLESFDSSILKEPSSASAHFSLQSSIKFPINAFMVENPAEFCNPTLFSEVYSMAFISASIFAFAEVREAARLQKIDNYDITSLPVSAGTIVEAFRRNHFLFQSQLKPADYNFMSSLAHNTDIKNIDIDLSHEVSDNLTEIASASKKAMRTPRSSTYRIFARKARVREQRTSTVGDDADDEDYKRKALMLSENTTIHYFGDDSVESECLYMLIRSLMDKRIILIFRGSKTTQDWIKDSKLIVSAIKNPISDRPGQPPTIFVHKGFREYLYGESRTVTTDDGGSATSVKEEKGKNDDEKYMSSTKGDHNEVVTKGFQNEDLALDYSTFCKSSIDKQEDQRSTHNLLNILGFDLSSIKAKRNFNRSNLKTKSLIASEIEHELKDYDKNESEAWTIFNTSKSHKNRSSRLERILKEVNNLRKQFADHRLYVTGHSLGGALGLLTALEMAERFGKPGQPVTFVGIANPRAGTEGFRDACEVLEREGKMRIVGVHGHLDIVPMLPGSAFNRTTKRRFCQSGFELVLKSDPIKFKMRRFERADDNYFQRIGLALFRADKISERHHYVTYLKELEALERPLQKLHLNDFYDKLVEEGLFPCSDQKMTPTKVRAIQSRDSVFMLEKPSKKEMKRVLSADDLDDDDIEF